MANHNKAETNVFLTNVNWGGNQIHLSFNPADRELNGSTKIVLPKSVFDRNPLVVGQKYTLSLEQS
jgi:hypothetical protein